MQVFTPVCTTEFIAFAKSYNEFKNRNCELLGLSIDSKASHLAWVHNIHKKTGIKIPFPVVSDASMEIAKKYNMISDNISSTKTVRNVYIIDPEQNIRCILQYPMQNGRNIFEIIRILEAIQLTDKEQHYTPANWVKGSPTVIPPPKNYDNLLERLNSPNYNNCIDWYLCFNSKACKNFSNNSMHQMWNKNKEQ